MIDKLEVENFLEHHGVKGQKWGVRHPYGRKFDKHGHETPQQRRQRQLRNVKRVRNAVIAAAVVGYGAAFVHSMMIDKRLSEQRIKMHNNRIKDAKTLNDMLRPKSPGIKLNPDWKPQSLNRSQWYNYKPPSTAKEILKQQERQRNGAHQVRKMLKEIGEHKIRPKG